MPDIIIFIIILHSGVYFLPQRVPVELVHLVAVVMEVEMVGLLPL